VHVDGLGVTQVEHLEDADSQVCDFIETVLGTTDECVALRILVEDHAG